MRLRLPRVSRFPFGPCLAFAVCWWTAGGASPTAVRAATDPEPDRPNILWIVSEDNGPYLGCYGYANETPHIDGLAKQGILYERAYANAPVCAPARSTIITGCYASSLGTHNMRSNNAIPETIRLFPEYLRKAGYYTCNNSKTDYNLTSPSVKTAWDAIKGGHYKNRAEGQPFFAVFNLGTSHESSLHGSSVQQKYLDADFELPGYHPDTPEIRSNWVQYYEIIRKMDGQVGRILAELEDRGLADDTIVFYYADHGGILPRSKRFLYDTGTHVPLVVRFPQKYQHLAPAAPGSRSDRAVSFVDLAPTILSLTGVDVPETMQGHAFLGKQAAPPQPYAYLFRNRMDERYDIQRAVTDGRFRYIRNYHPHRIYGQHLEYLWRMPATKSWEAAFLAGKCNAAQSRFFQTKPAEELYNTDADPWEIHNLAADPAYAEKLNELRAANRAHLLRIRDAGLLPEAEMTDRGRESTIREVALDPRRYPIEEVLAAAEAATARDPAKTSQLVKAMHHEDPAVRYWAATGIAVLGSDAESARGEVAKLLADPNDSVRCAAAEAVAALGDQQAAANTLTELLSAENDFAVVRAVNVMLCANVPPTKAAREKLEQLAAKSGRGYVQRISRTALDKW
jgi:N-sulfoglucosamine sulfohydrolase